MSTAALLRILGGTWAAEGDQMLPPLEMPIGFDQRDFFLAGGSGWTSALLNIGVDAVKKLDRGVLRFGVGALRALGGGWRTAPVASATGPSQR